MSWIAPALSERVQLLIPSLEPADDGGSDFVFGTPTESAFETDAFDRLAPVATVWMGMKPVNFQGSGNKYIRGKQVNEAITHEFKCRKSSVETLGREYALGFSIGFKFMANLVNLKSDYWLMVQKGSAVKGRLFRVHAPQDNKEQGEYLNITAEEVEERGVGWPV